ncbi:MAG: acetyl-CoA C-acyltransferase [Candidatus Heimdallarchaeota archaeon]|nr:acetyl-CoA C-acyltransferase [Candidatus Heimdallarchaeota archaeon]MDH5647914.1 acetyl-CoA C-acyltransferase [Candidatus Heimdallarchaeota archaeon]
MKEVWLVDYARTPFSRSRPNKPEADVFGEIRGDELLAQLIMKFFDGSLKEKGVVKNDIDDVSVGVAAGVLENWTYGGKIPLYMTGFPHRVPSFSIDRQCGSAGFGMHVGIMEIMTGFSKAFLATGFEHMTRVRGKGIDPNRSIADPNSIFYRPDLDAQNLLNMLQTAQKLYEEEVPKFTKEDLDKFGVRSHNLTIQSQENNWFDGEIIPIEGHTPDNIDEKIVIDRDMNPRKSSLEAVQNLPRISKPFFLEKNGGKAEYIKREGTEEGVITAANSSPLNAGATAAVMMEAEEARKREIEPMAKIISIGWAGVDPSVMGRGPVPATIRALDHAGLKADQIDFWEINEAFSIVPLNCMDKLNIPEEKVNVMGGSMAIGHPLAATMIRLTGTLARILKDKKARYGVANACIGGGQGVATVIENIST